MTTEYYQIPSQQGLLPLDSTSPDPWLASATSSFNSLSLSDNTWGKPSSKPSLFEPGTADAISWKHVVPMQNAGTLAKTEVKAPKVPKQFHSTTSKIDAWSVVDNVVNNKLSKKNAKAPASPVLEQPVDDELIAQNRYKTELCKSFTETGICRYGVKCQFAHGKEEIRPILRHPKYKTETCKTFHTTGTCPYGIRCRFIHTRSKEESIVMMQKVPIIPVELEEEDVDDDDIISLNHPPGIPVPQWSKSWNMSALSPAIPRKLRATDHLVEPEPAF